MQNIPRNIRNKIRLEGECWVWAGYVVPGREVQVLNVPSPTAIEDESRPLMRINHLKPSPRASWGGQSKPAARVVMAHHLGVEYDDVPTLKNGCGNPLCVSPHHHRVVGKKRRARRFERIFGDKPTEAPPPADELLDRLIEQGPLPELGPENAAEELSLTEIPAETWAAYVQHCLKEQAA